MDGIVDKILGTLLAFGVIFYAYSDSQKNGQTDVRILLILISPAIILFMGRDGFKDLFYKYFDKNDSKKS